jgi:cation diffusion facilitator CzcD-associated flavoprotein CzcO
MGSAKYTTELKGDYFDCIVLGAGISGIDAAYHLKTKCPQHTFRVLEGRSSLGGTWDLFRYPGVRSDSDMFTFGFGWKPWESPQPIASGEAIRNYLQEAVEEQDLKKHICYNSKVVSADWISASRTWRLLTEAGVSYHCNFLFACTGYYHHCQGHTPEYEGAGSFKGQLVHPQQWNLRTAEYSGKRVVVVGSGATAITLVPSMAQDAAMVTMLQRSPSYIFAAPATNQLALWMHRLGLPSRLRHFCSRFAGVVHGWFFYRMARSFPRMVKANLLKKMRQQLPNMLEAEFQRHFHPSYNPWDQRVCLCPGGDFFEAIRSGKATVVTDHIERFTADGLLLRSGQELPADIVVTATGLELQGPADRFKYSCSRMSLSVDGEPYQPSNEIIYKGLMLSGLPNFAYVFGYTNASWTLKADLVCAHVCRLLNHMRAHGLKVCVPQALEGHRDTEEPTSLTSGYIQRSVAYMPKQGRQAPWKQYHDYFKDLWLLKWNSLSEQSLRFSR